MSQFIRVEYINSSAKTLANCDRSSLAQRSHKQFISQNEVYKMVVVVHDNCANLLRFSRGRYSHIQNMNIGIRGAKLYCF